MLDVDYSVLLPCMLAAACPGPTLPYISDLAAEVAKRVAGSSPAPTKVASVLALLEHPESLSVFNCVLYKYIMLNYIEPGKSNGKRA